MSIRDRQPWQTLPRPANSPISPPTPDHDAPVDSTAGFSRRRFIHTAAGTTAFALSSRASIAAAHNGAQNDGQRWGRTTPAPQPIPGGSDLSGFGLTPPYDFIHVFAPGEAGLILPFTGVVLQGLDVEPGTITDFDGFTAVAFHVGEARGSDGNLYNLETDFRFMDGRYVAVDGTTRHGSFALI